jgi:hypothetical protein
MFHVKHHPFIMKGIINYGICTTVWNNTIDEKYQVG